MFEIIVIFVCLIINALLSASEIAFVSVNRRVLRQMERICPRKTRRLGQLRDNPEKTLSVLQLGITLVGLVSGAIGGAGVEESIGPWLMKTFDWGENTAELVGVILVVLPLTALMVILGELVPKVFALRRPFEIASSAAPWLWGMGKVFYPLIFICEWTTRRMVRGVDFLFRKRSVHSGTPASETSEEQVARQHERYFINLANLESKCVQDIMCSWPQVVTLDLSNTLEEVLEIITDSGHTRLPVCGKGKVKGLVNTKEVVSFALQGGTDWILLLRPVVWVEKSESLIRVLRIMQEKRSHLAVVESTGDKPEGILTLEDILEEIVGDIGDEDDDRALDRLLAEKVHVKKGTFGSPF
jgi:putative hemolysin